MSGLPFAARRRQPVPRCGICLTVNPPEDTLEVLSSITGERAMFVCRPGVFFDALAEDPNTNRQYCFRRAVTCSTEHFQIRPLAERPWTPTEYPVKPGTPAWYQLLEAAGA
jgi:hypothetical protein